MSAALAGGFSLGAQPRCDVSTAASSAKLAAACAASAHAPALAVSGEEAQYSRFLRAHRAALVAVFLGPIKQRCAGERIVFFGAWLWCDVLTAAFTAKPAASCAVSARALLLAFSGEEA